MKPVPENQRLLSREHLELVLLKALIWKDPLYPEIIAALSAQDFSADHRRIYTALVNMVDIGIEIKKDTLENAIEVPLTTPLFDVPPREKEVASAFELFRQKLHHRKKALEKISTWKKTIDSLTELVEEGKLDPRIWVERMQNLIPSPKIDEKKKAEPPRETAEEKTPREMPGALEPDWSNLISLFEKGEPRELSGLKTGIQELDRKSLGLKGLNVLSGSPKMGKTTLALQLATEIARHNDCLSVFYSMEMDRKSLMLRILSRISHIPYEHFVLCKGKNLADKERARFTKSREVFDTFRQKMVILDRTSTELDSEQIFYQIDALLKRAQNEKVFIVIDSLPSFSLTGKDMAKPSSFGPVFHHILGKFRLIQQYFGAIILLVYPKHYGTHQDQEADDGVYDLVHVVDTFFELLNKSKTSTASDYYNEYTTEAEEIDLCASSRETGQWYIPLTFMKSFFDFTHRKKGFKATKITWGEQEEPKEPASPKEKPRKDAASEPEASSQ
ncbi:MAG: DnaB-like helicase C-terminal domain-containing protein [Candidatus Eremiobacteraeota bacterium]|nr:DnaB-like helicase C-terminal domain-containing protein [Candidatus Eremiobacteraeota bacterium]